MKLYRSTDRKFLTLKLFDQSSSKFIRATLFDQNMVFLSTLSLAHIFEGLYSVEVSLSTGSYNVVFQVFKDSLFTNRDKAYADSEEQIVISEVEGLISNAVTVISDKIDDNDGMVGISC